MPRPKSNSLEKPRFILQLDDLPKVVQADGFVYPIYMPISDVARLFGIDSKLVREWAARYEWPTLIVGGHHYLSVAFVTEWIAANTRLFRESADIIDADPASSGVHSSVEGSA